MRLKIGLGDAHAAPVRRCPDYPLTGRGDGDAHEDQISTDVGAADASIAALIAAQPPGKSSSRASIPTPGLFRRDVERVVMRHWLCTAREQPAKRGTSRWWRSLRSPPSSCAARTVIRALVNVCRHRGRGCAGIPPAAPGSSSAPTTAGPTASTARSKPPATCPTASMRGPRF